MNNLRVKIRDINAIARQYSIYLSKGYGHTADKLFKFNVKAHYRFKAQLKTSKVEEFSKVFTNKTFQTGTGVCDERLIVIADSLNDFTFNEWMQKLQIILSALNKKRQ